MGGMLLVDEEVPIDEREELARLVTAVDEATEERTLDGAAEERRLDEAPTTP